MSQKKVDSYKAGKAGRSKASRKEKLIDKLEILACCYRDSNGYFCN